jgi:hypothetical protein
MGSMYFFLLLHALHEGTTFPLVDLPPLDRALPPLRASQFPGFLPLPAERGIVYVIHEIIEAPAP